MRFIVEITAPTVTSEPVPAVVGMAYKGELGLRLLRIPTYCGGVFLLVAAMAITLATSIDEPPPTANTESQFSDNVADRLQQC